MPKPHADSHHDDSTRLIRHFWVLVTAWTAIIGALFVTDAIHIRDANRHMARDAARANFNKDYAFRLWGASHGGVYVPVTDRSRPNPYLAQMTERDIITPSGQQLTLMNPAYMVRQMMTEYAALYGVRGSVTSLNPIRPENAPDSWQRAALMSMVNGTEEVFEFTDINGAPYLRLMRPIVVKEQCLKCHVEKQYAVGELRGGVTVSLPMEPYLANQRQQLALHGVSFTLLWLFGLTGISISTRGLHRQIKQRDSAETELRKARDELEERVRERTARLTETNLSLEREVGERKAAEEATRRAHAELNQIFDCSGDAMCVIDQDFNVLRANRTFFAMFDIDAEQFVGHKCYRVWPGPLCNSPHCPLIRILSGETRAEYHDFEKYGAKGDPLSVIMTATPLYDAEGKLVGIVESFKDNTERKRVEQTRARLESQLRQSQKMEAIGTLAGGIAHDFNNILAAILGHAELAIDRLPIDSTAQKNLEQIFRASLRGKHLVEQILSFSRGTEQEFIPLHLSQQLHEVYELLRATLPTTVDIEIDIQTDSDQIMADPIQIHQVLMNLCSNANFAMRQKGGVLTITLDDAPPAPGSEVETAASSKLPVGRYLRLRVSDTGCGMSKEVAERIFDPFYTTKKVGEGTGMGLAVVHGIVTSHGGAIQVTSTPGQGSTFDIFLPRTSEETSDKVEEAAVIPIGNERILFVDDEEVLVDMARQMLGELGYEVDGYTSSTNALQQFLQSPQSYDLVITDQTMPKLTGIELASAIIKHRPTTPIILYTGYSESVDAEEALAIGIKAFVMKPILARELAMTVRSILDNSQAN